jgi:glycosyltransferase involved in cell wall biosynthesis
MDAGAVVAARDEAAAPAVDTRVAVIIPCHDEATTIGKVIADFARVLPEARIIVVDNASADGTADVARRAGADVVFEARPGKGAALGRGLREARSADYFVMVDGDDTYSVGDVRDMLIAARAGADMVVGTRHARAEDGAFRWSHSFGNRLFIVLVRILFGIRTQDLFSGYRVLTRRFLETAPLIAKRFEVEAELSLQARVQELRVAEVPVSYRPRCAGSRSKLRTVRDGSQVLMAILVFFRDYRPMAFFGTLSALLGTGSLVAVAFVMTRFGAAPPGVLAALSALALGLFVGSVVCMTCGVLLSSINRRSAEIAARQMWR